MPRKLTLSIKNQTLVDQAKDYATDIGETLSSLVEKLLLNEINKNKGNSKKAKTKKVTLPSGNILEVTGIVAELAGSLKGLDPNIDYKKEYKEYRAKKYS